jgi:hypothetical protein
MYETRYVFSYIELVNILKVHGWNTLYWRLEFKRLLHRISCGCYFQCVTMIV